MLVLGAAVRACYEEPYVSAAVSRVVGEWRLHALSRMNPRAAVLIAMSIAHAASAQPSSAPAEGITEHDASDTKGAPRPGAETGRIDGGEPEDSAARIAARTALFLPRAIFEIATAPLTATVWLTGRYQLEESYLGLFYSTDHTIGIAPVASWITGAGFSVGARVFDIDTFGERERFLLEATAGAAYRSGVFASLDSGTRFDRLRLEASGSFERRPAEPFYGIGNDGRTITHPGPMPDVDALVDSTAIASHFRYQEIQAGLLADVAVIPDVRVTARGSIAAVEYSHSRDDPSVEDVYDPASLVGFGDDIAHVYGELELTWDTRRPATIWEPPTVHGSGSLVSGFIGYLHAFGAREDFWHYGANLQHFFPLGYGPRVIVARLHLEGVTGELDDISLTELPMLGGASFLRGYPYARFRDRIAAVGSLQYMWPLSTYASAYVFTDVGRVYRDWSELDLRGLHLGYGFGLDLHTSRSFVVDVAIGSSSDGGLALTAEFTPVLDARPRWR